MIIFTMLLFVALLFIGCLFYGIAYPIWVLVHCANSKRSTASKTIWIILIVFTWTLASMIYGLFASRHRGLQWFSVIFLIWILVSVNVFLQIPEDQLQEYQGKIQAGQVFYEEHQLEYRSDQEDQFLPQQTTLQTTTTGPIY
jgi:hypothetical protein